MRSIRELFPTDDPVKPELLIGRQADVESIAARLAEGTHMVLAGPRRTGKSTVALAAIETLRDRGVYVADVDLWDHQDLPALLGALGQSILCNRGAVAKALRRAHEVGRDLRELLPTAVTAGLRTQLGDTIDLALALPGGRASAPSLGDAVRLAQRIAAHDERRIVLLLDEFADIGLPGHRFGDPSLLTRQLRAELQRSPLVTVLFAGSIEHLMRELFGPAGSALSQFGSFHELGQIVPSEWEAGIASRYEELEVAFDPAAIAEIVSFCEGYPRATMLLARETLNVALSSSSERIVRLGDVGGGIELALQSDRLRHEQVIERLRATRHAYPTALRVALGQRPYSGSPAAGVARALTMMVRAGIAEHRGRGDWGIPDPLLRAYLARRPQSAPKRP